MLWDIKKLFSDAKDSNGNAFMDLVTEKIFEQEREMEWDEGVDDDYEGLKRTLLWHPTFRGLHLIYLANLSVSCLSCFVNLVLTLA